MKYPKEAPWLTAKVDQRVEFMIQNGALALAQQNGSFFIMSFLDEGKEDMTDEERERWERTCDNCGKYADPRNEEFYTGYTARTIDDVQIVLAFGICGTCKESTTEGTSK